MKFKHALGLTLLAASLSACVATPPKPQSDYVYNTEYSYAKNLIEFVKMENRRDFKDAKIKGSTIKTASKEDPVFIAGTGYFALSGIGFSGIEGALGLGLINSLSHATQYGRQLYLIPENLANTPEEARALVKQAYHKAVKKIISEYPTKTVSRNSMLGLGSAKMVTQIDTEFCNKSPVYCNVDNELNISSDKYEDLVDTEFTLVNRPEFIPGTTKKIWVGSVQAELTDDMLYCGLWDGTPCGEYAEKVIEAMHKELPSWTYSYEYNPKKLPIFIRNGVYEKLPLAVVVKE